MKESKTLMDMTPQELREEIGRLTTTLNRVHEKNKRRRKALKELNKHAILGYKARLDVIGHARRLEMTTTGLELQNRHLTKEIEKYKGLLHDAMHGKIQVTKSYTMEETGPTPKEPDGLFFRFTRRLRGTGRA